MRTQPLAMCPLCDAPSSHAQRVRSSADIVKCPTCQLVYLRRRPLDEDLRVMYQRYADDDSHMRLPKSFEEQDMSGLRRERFLDFCIGAHTLAQNAIVADIGCGWGALLYAIHVRYPSAELLGFEICKKAAAYCNEKIAPCKSDGQFWESINAYGQMHLVTMCHVLEHMTDLHRALNHVRDMLRSGGMFAGIVPNFSSRGSHVYKDGWYWLDPNFHYLHFTPHVLYMALQRSGFHSIVIETHRGDFDPHMLRKAYEITFPECTTDEKLHELIASEDKEGRGEEIWFRCLKK